MPSVSTRGKPTTAAVFSTVEKKLTPCLTLCINNVMQTTERNSKLSIQKSEKQNPGRRVQVHPPLAPACGHT